jgi:hypothetical protein
VSFLLRSVSCPPFEKKEEAECQWLMPVILAIQETEIKRIAVRSQTWQIVHETLSQKNPSQKTRASAVAQGIGPEFKSQCCKKKKKGKGGKNSSLELQTSSF